MYLVFSVIGGFDDFTGKLLYSSFNKSGVSRHGL